MKWFKHISDSLDDPFIFELMTKHGSDGYLVFFGVLEIYAREFKPEDSWNLCVTLSYLKQKFHKTHKQLITNPLQTISNSGKWHITIEGDKVTVFIPKFTELLDEWSKRKLGSHSGVTRKILNTDKDKDTDKDKEIKKQETATPPVDDLYREIKNQIDEVCYRLKGQIEQFNPFEAATKYLTKLNYHPKAVLAALISIEKRHNAKIPFTKGAWAYLNQVIKQETPIANAKDSEAQCNAFKSDKLADLLNITFREVK